MKIRPLHMDDFGAWLPLWTQNNQGQSDSAITAQTWQRLTDASDARVQGLCAVQGQTLLGLAHIIVHPTTGTLNDAAYLQDVFVDPAHRGKGIASKLINAVIDHGKKERWSRLYWLAERNNEAAQALYKKIAQPIDFTVHVLPL